MYVYAYIYIYEYIYIYTHITTDPVLGHNQPLTPTQVTGPSGFQAVPWAGATHRSLGLRGSRLCPRRRIMSVWGFRSPNSGLGLLCPGLLDL